MEYLALTRKLISTIGVIIVALSVTFFRDIINIIDNWGYKKYVVIIGILSSPENFQSRASIRDTWLNFASDLSLAYHFVIGKHLCKVHPLDRVSPLSCVENWLSIPENVTSETEFSVLVPKKEEKKISNSGKMSAIGFGFHTLRGITVKRLGIVQHVLSHASYVRVKLRSSDKLKTLASVTITRDLMALDESNLIMKSISPVELEQNTENQLIIEFPTNDAGLLQSCEDFQWNFTPGVVNYLQLIQLGDRKPWPFSSDSCSYVSMNYTIADVNLVKSHILGKKERADKWKNRINNISRLLKNESDFYGDLMFVDVVDVYRNLPKKLVQFFKRIVDREVFHYVLKTDDDSFIDVERVYRQLSEELNFKHVWGPGLPGRKLWWWSKYRDFWKVQETGKWREDDYRSAAYPSFPCGGGYVLSKEIVRYLCDNDLDLQFFQGEDVSVGIWLSALKTVQHRTPIAVTNDVDHIIQERIVKHYRGDEDWFKYLNSNTSKLVSDLCEWTCDEQRNFHVPQCNGVQLTPVEIYKVWEKYKGQGFL